MVLFYLKRYQEALTEMQACLSADNIKAHYYVGRILALGIGNERSKPSDAVLHFEQCAKSQDAFYAVNAAYCLALLQVQSGNLPGALATLDSINNDKSKRVRHLKQYINGVRYLQRNKVKQGITELSEIIEVLNDNDPLFLSALKCRAYGYVAIEKYDQALIDIKGSKSICRSADKCLTYNKNLSKGILRMDNEDYLMAAKYFSKAWKVFPSNKDCYCLQVISIVQSYTYSLHGFWIDQPIKYDKVQETKFFVEKAIANCQHKDDYASLYFFKALLNFHLHNFYECT